MNINLPQIKLLDDFKSFLLKHGVIGLAIGVVIGSAVGKLVKAFVDDLIMPIVGFLTPSGDWRSITFNVGTIKFGIGDFIGNLVDFSIVAFVVFMIIKTLLHEPQKAPSAPTKQCPDCLENIPLEARRCKFCTSLITK